MYDEFAKLHCGMFKKESGFDNSILDLSIDFAPLGDFEHCHVIQKHEENIQGNPCSPALSNSKNITFARKME